MTDHRRNFIARGQLLLHRQSGGAPATVVDGTHYIHITPVKHRLVARVRDWPYSSCHCMVKLGLYPEDWAGDVSHDGGIFGERQ
jgi:hypothetical protein